MHTMTYGIYEDEKCIVDGTDILQTLKDAEDYFENKAIEDGLDSEGEAHVTLITCNEDTGFEVREAVSVRWCLDSYDGGKWDYRKGIGAV